MAVITENATLATTAEGDIMSTSGTDTTSTPSVADQDIDVLAGAVIDGGTDDTDLTPSVDDDKTKDAQTTDVSGDGKPDLDTKTKQEKADFAFAKQQRKAQTEARRAEAAEAKLAEANAKLESLTATKRPKIPDLPDTFDTDYAGKMALRDQALLDQKDWDSAEVQKEQAIKDQQLRVQDKQVQDFKKKQDSYFDRGAELGIVKDDLAAIGKQLTPFITPNNVATVEYIMERDDGPLLVKYIQSNPVELDKITKMEPMHAAVYISESLAEKAKTAAPATPTTPAPADTLEGSSPPEKVDPMIKGAKFE